MSRASSSVSGRNRRRTGTADGAETRFAVDAMLGSLARKLRIFGFDTYYHGEGTDEALIRKAKREGRIILTADKALSASATKLGARALLLAAGNDSKRLAILAVCVPMRHGASRCAICNGTLTGVGRRELGPRAVGRHRLYFVCDGCGKVYWRGRHWTRLRRLARILR